MISIVRWQQWFAWYPVRLQFSERFVWLCWVEYEQIRVGQNTGAFGSGSRTITHYRVPITRPHREMGQ
jgi:hypothetical protein